MARTLDSDHAGGDFWCGEPFADYWGRPQCSAVAGGGCDVRLHCGRDSNNCLFRPRTLGFAARRGVMIIGMFSEHLWAEVFQQDAEVWEVAMEGVVIDLSSGAPAASTRYLRGAAVRGWVGLAVAKSRRGADQRILSEGSGKAPTS